MTIQEQLQNHMHQKHISTTAVARAIDVSNTTLSLWLNNKYPGDNKKIERSVISFLEREEQRKSLPIGNLNFVMTATAKKINEAAMACHLEGEISVVYGEAGLGKTWGIKEYCKKNPEVILIETTPGFTAKYLFFELTRALGSIDAVNLNDMFNDANKRLQDSGRMIIIDEAEHLPYRALELLRRLHDKSGVGIMLVGMPMLINNLRGRRGEYAQLYSRIGFAVEVKPVNLKDTEKIIAEMLPNTNGLFKYFYSAADGNLRKLSKLYKRAVKMAAINNVDINAEIVHESKKLLIGR